MRPNQRIAEKQRSQKPWQVQLRRFFAQAWVEIAVGILVIVSVALTLVEFALESKIWIGPGQWTTWETDYGTFDRRHLNGLALLNFCITLIFAVELTLRYLAAPSKREYFKEFWLDILATLPIFRVFRGSRALRLLRLVRMIRLTGVISRLSSHYPKVFRAGAIDFLMITGLLVVAVVFGTVGILHFERGDVGSVPFASADGESALEVERREGLANSFWFSVYTLFAGEPIPNSPKTLQGKFVTVLLMFMGMTIFAIFTGTVSAFMVDRIRSEGRVVEWDDLQDHIVICGWTPKTRIIIEEYRAANSTRNTPIVVITELELGDLEQDISDITNLMIITDDFTKVTALNRAGIERARSCLVLHDTIGSRTEQDADARTILAALTVEKINEDVYTCAELHNSAYATHLEMGKVNDYVISEEYGAFMMAQSGLNRGLARIMNELLSYRRGNEFHRIAVPEDWIGKSFDELLLLLRKECNAILVGVLNKDGEQTINPADYQFDEGDEIVCIAPSGLEINKS